MRELARRDFLQWTAALSATAFAAPARADTPKPLRGIFPIAWSPCTPDNVLDLDAMAAQTAFCNRGNVAGLAWPQNASGWMALSEKERLAGAEAMLSAGKGGKTSLMIGVQSIGADIPTSVRFAKHAAAHGADAIISLPPDGKSDQAIIDYYKAIGTATDLPLMVQAVGDMSVELIVRMATQISDAQRRQGRSRRSAGAVRALQSAGRRQACDFLGRRRAHLVRRDAFGLRRLVPVHRPCRSLPGDIRSLARGTAQRGVRSLRTHLGLQFDHGGERLCDGGTRRVQGNNALSSKPVKDGCCDRACGARGCRTKSVHPRDAE